MTGLAEAEALVPLLGDVRAMGGIGGGSGIAGSLVIKVAESAIEFLSRKARVISPHTLKASEFGLVLSIGIMQSLKA